MRVAARMHVEWAPRLASVNWPPAGCADPRSGARGLGGRRSGARGLGGRRCRCCALVRLVVAVCRNRAVLRAKCPRRGRARPHLERGLRGNELQLSSPLREVGSYQCSLFLFLWKSVLLRSRLEAAPQPPVLLRSGSSC